MPYEQKNSLIQLVKYTGNCFTELALVIRREDGRLSEWPLNRKTYRRLTFVSEPEAQG